MRDKLFFQRVFVANFLNFTLVPVVNRTDKGLAAFAFSDLQVPGEIRWEQLRLWQRVKEPS